jgi:hypothetical protein
MDRFLVLSSEVVIEAGDEKFFYANVGRSVVGQVLA